ncbi:MAG: SpoVA/SpoVAEb family sporulation membrane protein [Oscillospiraceae bacterium]
MQITPKQYQKMCKITAPKSKSIIDIPLAFLIGGGICVLGQYLLNVYKNLGLDEKAAAAWVSVSLILLSALMTGFGLYEKVAKRGGAGTLVPITGFANAVVSPALEFKTEGFVLGLGAKIFIISGPVILYGTVASVVYGIIYFFVR